MGNSGSKLGKIALLSTALMGGLTGIVSAEENKPAILNNFDYASHRNVPAIDGKCYNGKIFNYDLLSDDTISQTDKKRVKFEPIWFYDIDNDGMFGEAEKRAIKAGIPIFMHQAFNDIANAKVRKFLELAGEYSSLKEQLKEAQKNSETKDVQHQIIEKTYETLINRLMNDLEKARVQVPLETPKQETPVPQTPKQEIQKEKDYRGIYLLAQQAANADLNSYITSIGARVNPFKNADLGFGANLDIGFGLDNKISSYSASLSAGRTASGTKTDMGKFSIGASLEAQLGPFILGGGIDYKLWTKETIEQILSQSGSVVKSNTNAVSNRQVFGKVYGGIEVPLGDKFKLGMIGGYNGKDGAYFGIRGGFKVK